MKQCTLGPSERHEHHSPSLSFPSVQRRSRPPRATASRSILGEVKLAELGCCRPVSPLSTKPLALRDPVMSNGLAEEISPYLLQHAGNPVDWHPWGEAAFAAAGSSRSRSFSRSAIRPAIGAT